MAAIVYQGGCDLQALHAHLRTHLPDYARPMFLRIQEEIDVTGTFKQKKVDLVKDGFRSVEDRRCDLFQRSAVRQRSCGSMPRFINGSRRAKSACDRNPASDPDILAQSRSEEWFAKRRCVRPTRSARRFLETYEGGRRGNALGLGKFAPTGALALASCLINFRATCSAAARALSRPTRWRARWLSAPSPRVSTAACRRANGSSFICRSSTRNCTGRPAALHCVVPRHRRRGIARSGPTCTPTSSAGSAASHIAMPRLAGPPLPESGRSSTAAVFRLNLP